MKLLSSTSHVAPARGESHGRSIFDRSAAPSRECEVRTVITRAAAREHARPAPRRRCCLAAASNAVAAGERVLVRTACVRTGDVREARPDLTTAVGLAAIARTAALAAALALRLLLAASIIVVRHETSLIPVKRAVEFLANGLLNPVQLDERPSALSKNSPLIFDSGILEAWLTTPPSSVRIPVVPRVTPAFAGGVESGGRRNAADQLTACGRAARLLNAVVSDDGNTPRANLAG